MTAPLSIVVINYNYAAFLTACLESVLAQTVACEVIVSDDGSTDASREIIERYIPRGVIALFNVAGSLFFGWAGGHWPKLVLLGVIVKHDRGGRASLRLAARAVGATSTLPGAPAVAV